MKKIRKYLGSVKKRMIEKSRKFSTTRHSEKEIRKALKRTIKKAKQIYPDKKLIHIRKLNDLKKSEIKNKVFILNLKHDEDLAFALREIKNKGGRVFSLDEAHPVAEYMHQNKNCLKAVSDAWDDTKKLRLSHFDPKDFQNIIQAIEITRDIKGDYVEIGVFMGSSGNVALNYMDKANIKRNCYFFDTFEGFNYKNAKESFDALFQNTHQIEDREVIPFVNKLFSIYKNKFKVIKSNICEDSLPNEIKKISVCNIDVDLYDAVKSSLEKASPLISKRGIIICEDFGHTPALGGANLAVREFIKTKEGKKYLPVYMASGQMFLIKKG